jgi:hypothetical protein
LSPMRKGSIAFAVGVTLVPQVQGAAALAARPDSHDVAGEQAQLPSVDTPVHLMAGGTVVLSTDLAIRSVPVGQPAEPGSF